MALVMYFEYLTRGFVGGLTALGYLFEQAIVLVIYCSWYTKMRVELEDDELGRIAEDRDNEPS